MYHGTNRFRTTKTVTLTRFSLFMTSLQKHFVTLSCYVYMLTSFNKRWTQKTEVGDGNGSRRLLRTAFLPFCRSYASCAADVFAELLLDVPAQHLRKAVDRHKKWFSSHSVAAVNWRTIQFEILRTVHTITRYGGETTFLSVVAPSSLE